MNEPADQSLNTDSLLMILMTQGWKWGPSEMPGMLRLMKDDFGWYLDSLKYNVGDILRAIEHEALNRGVIIGKQMAEVK